MGYRICYTLTMLLVQIRTFVEVYRQGSLSAAALQLGLTQPAVSQHIASLENHLGRKLFTRHARGVAPTAIADDLARQTGDPLDSIEEALSQTRATAARMAGTIHLTGPSDILSDLVSPHLGVLTRENLSVDMHPAIGDEIATRLLEGTADFGFAVIKPDDARLEACLAGREEILLAVPPEMAGFIQAADTLGAALEEQPFVSYSAQRDLMRFWMQHHGIDVGRSEEKVTAPDLRALRRLVSAGLGWSILPRYLIADQLADGSLVSIPGANGPLFIDYYLLRTKASRRTPRLVAACKLLLESFDTQEHRKAGTRL